MPWCRSMSPVWARSWYRPAPLSGAERRAVRLRRLLALQSEAHRLDDYTAAEAFEQEIRFSLPLPL